MAYSIHCFHHKENIFPNCTLLLKLRLHYLKNKAHVSKKGQLWKIPPKRIKKLLLLLLRAPTPARKCQMQRFPKSQVSHGGRVDGQQAGGREAAARPETARGGGHPDSETQGKFPNSSLCLPGLLLKVWVLPEGRVLGVQQLRGAREALAPSTLSVRVKRDRGGPPGLRTCPLRGRRGLHLQRAPQGCRV